ncbi:toxin-antitoxin system YwqK family antitoxin [Lutibacter sp.]|uniref:toxin-antitoxin system YwqK family antitoxin n=1 Tax=Lutibacter sp. TaxID=1925666 RepID=UPI00356715C0
MFKRKQSFSLFIQLISVFILFIGCHKNTQDSNSINQNASKIYPVSLNSNEPITGALIIKDSLGNIKVDGNLNEGKIDGKWIEYFQNGEIKHERNYSDEKYHGINKEYYQNGQLKWIGRFEYGKKIGQHKEWYKNGKIKSEIYYVDDKIEGLWKQWDENGVLISGVNTEEKKGFFKRLFGFINP